MLQEATHFKRVRGADGRVLYEPCSPGDVAAEEYTLTKLAEEGKAELVGCRAQDAAFRAAQGVV